MAAPTRLKNSNPFMARLLPGPRQSYLGLNLLDFNLPLAEISLYQGLGAPKLSRYKCLLWVISGHTDKSAPCPLYPR